MTTNYITGLTARQREKYRNRELAIHRYMSVSRLFELLRSKLLPFADAATWADPFEGYMTDQIPGARAAEVDSGGFCYFSCWTLAGESDHLWRLYTPNTDGVRISVKLHTMPQRYPEWTIRKVRYLSIERIRKKILQYKEQTSDPALRHFIKRIAFKAEEEVRIMIRGPKDDWGEDMITQPFDPHLITTILFDPRMDDELYSCIKAYLKSTYNIRASIKHSQLYRPERTFGAQQ